MQQRQFFNFSAEFIRRVMVARQYECARVRVCVRVGTAQQQRNAKLKFEIYYEVHRRHLQQRQWQWQWQSQWQWHVASTSNNNELVALCARFSIASKFILTLAEIRSIFCARMHVCVCVPLFDLRSVNFAQKIFPPFSLLFSFLAFQYSHYLRKSLRKLLHITDFVFPIHFPLFVVYSFRQSFANEFSPRLRPYATLASCASTSCAVALVTFHAPAYSTLTTKCYTTPCRHLLLPAAASA